VNTCVSVNYPEPARFFPPQQLFHIGQKIKLNRLKVTENLKHLVNKVAKILAPFSLEVRMPTFSREEHEPPPISVCDGRAAVSSCAPEFDLTGLICIPCGASALYHDTQCIGQRAPVSVCGRPSPQDTCNWPVRTMRERGRSDKPRQALSTETAHSARCFLPTLFVRSFLNVHNRWRGAGMVRGRPHDCPKLLVPDLQVLRTKAN